MNNREVALMEKMENKQILKDSESPEAVGVSDKYQISEEVREIVSDLVQKHHHDLAEANILCLFRKGEWNSNGRARLASASKVPEIWRCLYGYDLMVVINKNIWVGLEQEHKVALVDHELCHFGQEYDSKGNVKYTMVQHDIEEFSAVVDRHGLWHQDVKVFAQYVQMALQVEE